jgi:uncharacterized protein YndB with AHSA1/START domain
MTTPDVPLRFELSIELPGTAEQVWDALATADGISAWFLPTDVEEGEGGAVLFHMGPTDSAGRITGWDPSRRLAYEEADWANLSGHDDAPVTPLATEFLIEARSGGTCVVRVVSSAFGTGADWEQEFFDEMGEGWAPYFEHLRVYLEHFPGQTATPFNVEADVKAPPAAVADAMAAALGLSPATVAGDPVDLRGLPGVVERIGEQHVLARITDEVPGYFAFFAYRKGDGVAAANITGYLFSDRAPAYVVSEEAGWKAWLDRLEVPAT